MGRSDPILQVSRLSASRGGALVLRDFDLVVRVGEVVALLGPNGAGKSTAVDAICGLAPKSGGSVRFERRDITRLAPHEIVRLGLIQVSQNRDLFPGMTVGENLQLGIEALPHAQQARNAIDEVVSLFPKLGERRTQKAGLLSGGEQQMLAIARALLSRPKALLLDEPSAGLAPVVLGQIGEFLRGLTRSGLTILLVEQNVAIALELCARFVVVKGGKKVFDGDRGSLGTEPRRFLAELYI